MDAKDLVLRIIQDRPNLSKTKLVKLCYLVDLAWVELYGHQNTNLPYQWWQRGPFCPEIENAIWELQDSGVIEVKQIRTKKDFDCELHRPLGLTAPALSDEETAVVDTIAARYGQRDLDDLIEFVYKTAPMMKAQKLNARYKLLDMTVGLDEIDSEVEEELAQMALASLRDFKEGRTVPADELLEKLNS